MICSFKLLCPDPNYPTDEMINFTFRRHPFSPNKYTYFKDCILKTKLIEELDRLQSRISCWAISSGQPLGQAGYLVPPTENRLAVTILFIASHYSQYYLSS